MEGDKAEKKRRCKMKSRRNSKKWKICKRYDRVSLECLALSKVQYKKRKNYQTDIKSANGNLKANKNML